MLTPKGFTGFVVLLASAVAAPALAHAQVVSYEAIELFPEETEAWTHEPQEHQAERWIEDGVLVQHALFLPKGLGQRDTYYYSLAQFAGSPTFFCEWVVETDGPREAIPSVAPAAR